MQDYLAALSNNHNFSGDIYQDFTSRFVHATDNSIYQKLPAAIIAPKTIADIQLMVKLSKSYPDIFFAARGGGTGTNGQSLSAGIIIDLKTHFNKITSTDYQNNFIEVEPGVILNNVNKALAGFNYYFPVDISPYDRATIGGMIATDACGSGSYHHGRMGDNILEIKYIDHNGDIQIINESQHPKALAEILKLAEANKSEIEKNYPDHVRYATGYNLLKLLKTKNFNYLFAGSEGTIGIIISTKLKIIKVKSERAVIVNFYDNFTESINDVTHILKSNPYGIETMDEKILKLAKQDQTTKEIQNKIYQNSDSPAIALIEFKANDKLELQKTIDNFNKNQKASKATNHIICTDHDDIKALYLMRKNAVGIAANFNPIKKPIPFIEDAAVPVKHLAEYISELKNLLDEYKLEYVIYGHADVGLVHVRPALNLETQTDKKLLIEITSAVIQLVKKYNGVIWGEHSAGFRSPVAEEYFGNKIIEIFTEIKAKLDPLNIFNPGKIVADNSKQEMALDKNLQADFNKDIPQNFKLEFEQTLMCNGNAKCLSNDDQQLMCPTYKVTKNLKYSPKGRSQLLRLWLNLISKQQTNENKQLKQRFAKANQKILNQIYQSLNSCLACTACTSSCPVNVSISKQKSKFMGFYFKLYKKTKQVILLENLEVILCKLYRFRYFIKYFMKIRFLKNFTESFFNIKAVNSDFKNHNIKITDRVQSGKTYIFSDIASLLYAPEIIEASSKLLTKLNIEHEILKPMPTAIGFEHFGNTAKLEKYNNKLIQKLQAADKVIILDPAIYYLIQKNLQDKVNLIPILDIIYQNKDHFANISKNPNETIRLYSHCIANSMQPDHFKKWHDILNKIGLNIENVSQNCCGMAGFYGYQAENFQISEALYKANVQELTNEDLYFDGISCHLQNTRFGSKKSNHIIQKLAALIDPI